MAGRSLLRMGWVVAAAAIAVVAASCSVPAPASSPPDSTAPSVAGLASPTPTAEAPSSTVARSPSPSPPAMPGRPYDASAVLAAMQSSRRPGGVPEELQTDPIAGQIAGQVWTFDGASWPAISVSASCGPEACTLDISGTPDAGAGEDLYTFSVVPADATVELLVADLHGYPAELDAQLDAIARAGVAPDRLAGLDLVAARWLPPPRDGRFVLSYRSGGEEGSPALDVTIDLSTGRVLDAERPAPG